jgi:hypothetical protein
MGSISDCFDNALCESFFATLEWELLACETFRTPSEVCQVVFAFSEHWANYRIFVWRPDVPLTNNGTERVIGRMKVWGKAYEDTLQSRPCWRA